jgi:hypothetical protein
MIKMLIKKLFVLGLCLLSVSKVYSCTACWGKYDGEEIDFRKSNQPENISEKVKKYFPAKDESQTKNTNNNCKDSKDQNCKKTDNQKNSEKAEEIK